jgi:DNA-binding transcriptional ArsR family regulator
VNDTSLFAVQADLCRAMASATRVEIVHVLREGPRRVGDIAHITGYSQSTISRHLAVLRHAGVVVARRGASDICYEIANPKIVHICDLMREVLAEEADHRSQLLGGQGDEHPR